MNLFDIRYWVKETGMFSTFLNVIRSSNQYILLDGSVSDFCLQINGSDRSDEMSFSDSWSSNTKSYILLNHEKIKMYNWYNKKVSEYPVSAINDSFDSFIQIIQSNSYRTPDDIVPFVISLFRQMRNISGECKDPEVALNYLFRLLISLEDENIDSENLIYRWKIENITLPDRFDYFVEKIRNGVNGIKPSLDLILRHCSGPLFEEAQKEVLFFNMDRDLFGGVSNKLISRNSLYSSVHYTPQYVARSIVENCLSELELGCREEIKIFDPACGSGTFLLEVVKQLKDLGYSGKIKVIGFDISTSAVTTTKFLLDYEKRTQWNDTDFSYDIRKVEDSLSVDWPVDCDILVMNPPFMSWDLLSKYERDAVYTQLQEVFDKGKPNQAAAFFVKAISSVCNSGVIGTVLPYLIFYSDSYSKLRSYISENVAIKQIASLGTYVFEDALTSVSFLIAKKSTDNCFNPQVLWTKNARGIPQLALSSLRKLQKRKSVAYNDKNVSIYTPINFPLRNNSWRIISEEEQEFLSKVLIWQNTGRLHVVNDVFVISQGVITGRKGIFEIPESEYFNLSVNEKKYFRPLINSDSIYNGKITISEYLWYPYDKDGIMLVSESDIEGIDFIRRLTPYKNELLRRKGVDKWWYLTRPRMGLFEKEIRLYSTRFGSSASFAIDETGECVITEGNFYKIRSGIIEDYYFYLSVFSSHIFEKLLSIYAKQLLSGYDLSPSQIKNIPIPYIDDKLRESSMYKKMVLCGHRLVEGDVSYKNMVNDYLKILYP